MSETLKVAEAISRREVLQLLGKRALETAAVVALNATAFTLTDFLTKDDKEEQEKETARALETDQDLEVKFFAKEILFAGKEITSYSSEENLIEIVAGFFAGNTIGAYLLKNHSRLLNKKAGAMGAISGSTVDIISTIVAAQKMSDPRFEEYGFGVYFGEKNPIFSHNPSPEEIVTKSLAIIPASSFVGWTAPAIGRGYLGSSPFIASNNYEAAHVISTSLDLGDQVKVMIAKGAKQTEINGFLIKAAAVQKV